MLARLQARLSQISDCRLLTGLFIFAFLVRMVYLVEIKEMDFFSTLVGDGYFYDDRRSG